MQITYSSVPIATHERLGLLRDGTGNIFYEVACQVLIHVPFAHICCGREIHVSYPYCFSSLNLDTHPLGIFVAHIFYYFDTISDEDGNSSPFSRSPTFFVNLISRYIKLHGGVL
jgi:hypothetical protein